MELTRVLKHGDSGEDVQYVQKKLKEQGFFRGAIKGNYLNLTRSAVWHFQAAHIGPDGKPLETDGEVGKNTFWALENPVGNPQSNEIDPIIPEGLTEERIKVLQLAVEERRKGVKEVPNGANKGDGVDKYLKNGRAAPWCAYYVSFCFNKAIGRYPTGRQEGHCLTMWRTAKKQGTAKKKKDYSPIPGDIFILLYRNKKGQLSGSGHTGIVLRVSADGKYFNAAEGNASNRVKITKRKVSSSKLVGFINPYNDEPRNFEKGVNSGNLSDDSLSGTR